MRCDQPMGMTEAAEEYLKKYRKPARICPCCNQNMIRDDVVTYDEYQVAFGDGDGYPLHKYTLANGFLAEEYLQDTVWSSGPCFFLGLVVFHSINKEGERDTGSFHPEHRKIHKNFVHSQEAIDGC